MRVSFRRCILLPAIVVAISCGDGTGPSIHITPLTVGAPFTDNVRRGEARFYAVAVSPLATYRISLSGLSDDVDLYPFDDDGAFAVLGSCLISHVLFFSTTPEDCSTPASGDTMYIAVDASDVVAASASYTIAVQTLPVTDLTLSTPLEGAVAESAAAFYRVTVAPGTEYSLSISGLTDSATTFHIRDGEQGGPLTGVASPKALRLRAMATTMFLAVDGSSLTKPTSAFVVLAMPAPVLSVPIVPTSGAIPARTPTVGWVETRQTSRYRTEGLPAGTHTITVLGVTGSVDFEVDFDVFGDSTYSMELDCTLQSLTAKECTVSGSSVFFAVRAGPVNQTGAGYILLVW